MLNLTPSDIDDEAGEGDDALIVAARMDRRAFAPLYERYVTAIYRYCFHRLGNREAAEDATSLVFTKALAALPRFTPGAGSFRSWLFAIAYTTVADDFRHARPTSAMPADDLPATTPGPEAVAIDELQQAELHRLLAELPDGQRQVLELRLSGLSSPEVARVLGRSPTAIRSLQFRAVERLRSSLHAPSFSLEMSHGNE